MREEFGSRLRRQREKLGMTQMELANISGVSQTSIGCYERGTRFPKLETVRMIADAFHVGIGQLMPVQEVKRGRWTAEESCPFCGFRPWYENDIHTLSFCPNCGADLREDGE